MLDVSANRDAKKYSRGEMLARILWSIGYIFFRLSPRNAFQYRSWLLRLFGAKIGRHVHIYSSCRIFAPWNLVVNDFASIGERVNIYNLTKLYVGFSVTISMDAVICCGSHDYTLSTLPLKKEQVTLGDSCWICANSFVAMGVSVGQGSVVGAMSIVTSDIPSWSVYAGNPARFVKKRIITTKDI